MKKELEIAIRAKIEYIDQLKEKITAINYQCALANDRFDLMEKLREVLGERKNN